MLEPMIRGHVIRHTVRFFRVQCDPLLALRIDAELPLELRTTLEDIEPAGWYPRQYEIELLQAVARAHGGEEAAREDLLRCGAGMAVGDNEFTKLLMKVLTPELFLKKAERFWSRDHQDAAGYRLERCDIEQRRASLRLHGVAGYTHCGLIWMGWLRGVLGEICQSGFEVEQRGWSWANPAPNDVVYEVSWS
jgi:hypothetical protein